MIPEILYKVVIPNHQPYKHLEDEAGYMEPVFTDFSHALGYAIMCCRLDNPIISITEYNRYCDRETGQESWSAFKDQGVVKYLGSDKYEIITKP